MNILKTILKKIKNYFLIKKYPFLQIRNVWTDEKLKTYDYTWLDDMPKGWKKAFGMKMVKEIDEILGDFRKKYQITQIKEKYRRIKVVR